MMRLMVASRSGSGASSTGVGAGLPKPPENFAGSDDAGGGRDCAVVHDRDQHVERGFGVSQGEFAERRGAEFRRGTFERDVVHGVTRLVGQEHGVRGQRCLCVAFLRRGVSAFPRCRGYPCGPAHRSFSLCGLAAARAARDGNGARKMKNPPADCSGRVWGGVGSAGTVATPSVSVHRRLNLV